tara:strand:+ start:102 stop:296 length:195 start_codon:yes stop_codon:yes gene_type:complete
MNTDGLKQAYVDGKKLSEIAYHRAMIAEKRSDRIIVVVFGGKSTKTRNAQMIKLAELGFRKLQK